jgi:predicted GIY-YIG superfamily endonuclease/ribosomal protein L37E
MRPHVEWLQADISMDVASSSSSSSSKASAEAPLIVYVLKLVEGRYYVGSTRNLDRRLEAHLRGGGSTWTRLYPIVELIEAREARNKFDEDATTKEYMAEYGIDNVRGGSYVQEVLPTDCISFLQKEVWGATGACLRCGRMEHWASYCYAVTSVDGRMLSTSGGESVGVSSSSKAFAKPSAGTPAQAPAASTVCSRCGRQSHTVASCYAHTSVDGRILSTSGVSHAGVSSNTVCRRCGRQSHTAASCYAHTSVDGRKL